MTDQQIAFRNLQEVVRHNKATEANAENVLAESIRHSLKQEEISSATNVINDSHYRRQDAINASHYARQDAINASHYNNLDYENNRHNQFTERETARHNEAMETQAQMDWYEDKRHNVANEQTIPYETAYTEAKTEGQNISNKFAPTQIEVGILKDINSVVTDVVKAGSSIISAGANTLKALPGVLRLIR